MWTRCPPPSAAAASASRPRCGCTSSSANESRSGRTMLSTRTTFMRRPPLGRAPNARIPSACNCASERVNPRVGRRLPPSRLRDVGDEIGVHPQGTARSNRTRRPRARRSRRPGCCANSSSSGSGAGYLASGGTVCRSAAARRSGSHCISCSTIRPQICGTADGVTARRRERRRLDCPTAPGAAWHSAEAAPVRVAAMSPRSDMDPARTD